MNAVDLQVVNHEAAHAAGAHLLGLEFVHVKASRHLLVGSARGRDQAVRRLFREAQ